MKIAILAALGTLALLPASAAANGPLNPITVNESATDAPLASTGDSQLECVSESAANGCTLRAAVELANYESKEYDIVVTIDAPGETFGNTMPYGTFEIEPGARIVITGAGVGATKIEGAGEEPNRASIFTVYEGASLTLQKLTLLHGDAESYRGNGGGVDAEDGASLTVENSAIEENSADHDGGGVYGGDDSYLKEGASITIKHSTVTDNIAEGSDDNGGGDGGGVYGEPGASIAIEEGSTIAGNTADSIGGGVSAGTGQLVTNSECDFDAAQAKGAVEPASGAAAGLLVKQSKIDGNTAEGDGGGGVYVSEGEEEECVREEAKVHSSTELSKPATAGSDEAAITIEQSQIEGNDAAFGDGGGIAALNYGGCGESASAITILQSTIADNTAEDEDGGGIYAESDERGCDGARTAHAAKANVKPATDAFSDEFGLTIEQSTLNGNRAGRDGGGDGGGIFESLVNGDPIINSTIADNSAGGDGGGIYAAEGDFGFLVSDTVSDNTSEDGDAGNLAAEDAGALAIRDTIVTDSADQENCEGEIFSESYNLDFPSQSGGEGASADSCGLSASDHDLVGVEPQFNGGLQNNGGPTETIALASTSPAIGVVPVAGNCEEASPEGPGLLDQRGEPRPGIASDGCDIGAYEYEGSQPPPAQPEPKTTTTTTPPPAPAASANVLPFKAVVPPACTSKRDITIHIQHVKQLGVVSAVVSIDGHAKRTLRGKSLTTAIDLQGLPAGTFTVEIVAHLRDGRTLSGKRVYHTCKGTPLPGRSYLPL
jgi:hypothetical protein